MTSQFYFKIYYAQRDDVVLNDEYQAYNLDDVWIYKQEWNFSLFWSHLRQEIMKTRTCMLAG